jgi:multidrug efflux pump
MVSQVLTLYTTPVVYLYMERFRSWAQAKWDHIYHRRTAGAHP